MEVISVMQTNAQTREAAADGEDRPEDAWSQAVLIENKLKLSV